MCQPRQKLEKMLLGSGRGEQIKSCICLPLTESITHVHFCSFPTAVSIQVWPLSDISFKVESCQSGITLSLSLGDQLAFVFCLNVRKSKTEGGVNWFRNITVGCPHGGYCQVPMLYFPSRANKPLAYSNPYWLQWPFKVSDGVFSSPTQRYWTWDINVLSLM